MIVEIQKVQKEIENQEFNLQPAIEQTARGLLASKPELVPVFLTNYCLSNGSANLERWVDLADLLITKYNDGYVRDEKGRPREMGYPEDWLQQEIKKNPEKFALKEKSGSGKEL